MGLVLQATHAILPSGTVVTWLDYHNGTVTAIATSFLAVITFVYAALTRSLVKAQQAASVRATQPYVSWVLEDTEGRMTGDEDPPQLDAAGPRDVFFVARSQGHGAATDVRLTAIDGYGMDGIYGTRLST